jgi:multiple sugar transport system permease protein
MAVQLVAGLLIALLLEQRVRGNRMFRVIFLAPMMMAPVVAGLTWRVMLNDGYGVVNWMLDAVGLSPIFWLGSQSALLSVIVAETWQWLPFSILIFSIALSAIPGAYYESAAVDGASPWMIFRRVTLPNLKWAFFIIVIFKLSDAVKAFDVIYIMTGGGPGITTQTLAIYLQKTGFTHFEMGYASALSFLLLLISTLLLLPLIRRLIAGEKHER